MALFLPPLAFAGLVALALVGMIPFLNLGRVEKLLFPCSSGAANR